MKSQVLCQYDVSTGANFNTFGTMIYTALTAAGWTKTSDTGQVTWSSRTSSSSVPTSSGTVYEVWKMADSNQSTMPCFIRIDYYNDSRPALLFTPGTGSSGTGKITGGGTTFICEGANGNYGSTTVPYWCYFSGTTSSFRMLLFANSAQYNDSQMVVIERNHNAAGAETAVNWTFLGINNNRRLMQTYGLSTVASLTAANGTTTFGEAQTSYLTPPLITGGGAYVTDSWRNNVAYGPALMPFMPYRNGLENPLIGALVGGCYDFPYNASIFTVNIYGSTHNYVVCCRNLGSQSGWANNVQPTTNDVAVLMLWE